MKFPVNSLLAREFGIFRDEFAADSPSSSESSAEPDFLDHPRRASARRFGGTAEPRWFGRGYPHASPDGSHFFAGQEARLLDPGGELSFVELVVFVDVEVAHFFLLGLAGRDRT